MTVGAAGEGPGVLQQVVSERPGDNDTAEITLAESRGRILPDLTTGSDVAGAQPLQANGSISGRGVQLFGSGFIVTPQEAANLGLGQRRWPRTPHPALPQRPRSDGHPARCDGHRPVRADSRGGPSAFPGGVPVALRAGQAGAGPEQPGQLPQQLVDSRRAARRLAPCIGRTATLYRHRRNLPAPLLRLSRRCPSCRTTSSSTSPWTTPTSWVSSPAASMWPGRWRPEATLAWAMIPSM